MDFGNPLIRVLTHQEFAEAIDNLLRGATMLETPARYPGQWYLRRDDAQIGVRISPIYGLVVEVLVTNDGEIPTAHMIMKKP